MYSYKRIWNVSYPILIGLLAQNIINVTDTAFLGHVGEVELGASAMGGIYYFCWFTIFFGFSTGTQIIISRRNGERNYSAIGPIMIQGLVSLLILALIMIVLSHFFTGYIMRYMISSEVIWEATMTFLKWRMIGFVFDVFNVMFRAFYVGIIKTKILTVGPMIMAVANIILDYILIFGKLGFPAMGIEGAAIASVISTCISALFYVVYTFFTLDRRKYGFNRIKSFDFQLLKHVLNISVYIMFQYFVSMGAYFLFFVAIERQGHHSLAIANITRSIYIFMLIPLNALSATTNTLVSNIIGEGRSNEVMSLVRRISRLSFYIIAGCVLLLCLFTKTVLSLYTNEMSLIHGSVPSVYILAVALIVGSFACPYFNCISGTGDTRSAMILELIVLLIYTIHICLTAMYFRLPVHICLTVEIIYFAGLLIGSVLYLRFADWKKKKI